MKTFAILSLPFVAVSALLIFPQQGNPWRAMLFAAQDDAKKTQKQDGLTAQPKKTTDGKKPPSAEEDAATRRQTAQFAASLLQRCRATLRDQSVSTYQADLEQKVTIGGRSFTASGKYRKGPDLKFRLELSMVIGEGKDAVKARMLQVCDGEILMTEQVTGKKKRFTRRNVKQILAAAGNAAQLPRNELISEFGLGGMTGLIASLQRTMIFDVQTPIPTKTGQAVRIEGTWNADYTTHWINWMRQTRLTQLPAHVPERVRVLVDSDFYVREIEYLRRAADGKSFQPMLSLSFRNIQLNPKFDDKTLFQYVSEPGVFVEDVTAQYIQMFQPPPAGKK